VSADPGAKAADERRQKSRATMVTFAWYQVLPHPGSGQPGASGISQSCDVSETGIGLLTTRDLPHAARVFIELSTGLGGLSAVAEVANCQRTSDGRYRVGLKLLVVPPSDREAFDRIAQS
jgi:hypothetical protein